MRNYAPSLCAASVVAVVAMLAPSCSCDDDLHSTAEPPVTPPVQHPGAALGSVGGCVCDEAVGAWVAGADVYVITDSGNVVTANSDDAGCFLLADVPAGPQTLKIEKAPFSRDVPVTVVADQRVDIASPSTCEPPPADEVGAVQGRVCGPDGATFLAGADVYVETNGGAGRVQTSTDGDGRYDLESVPVGTQTVHIEKGPFSTTRDVVITAGATTIIPDDECALDTTVNIAVVTGNNDDVQVILDSIGVDSASITTYRGKQGFGVDSTAWGEQLLGDYAVLSQYDIVFINCGANGIDDYPLLGLTHEVVDNDTYIANLRQFVTEGGSVYVSDEAYDLVERAWPDFIDFYGDDTDIDAAQIGRSDASASQVNVVDANLAAAMGQSQFDIHYNYTLWAIIQGVAAGTTVYTRGDTPTSDGTMTDMPLTVGFTSGQGHVIYTSFHQEPGVDSATAHLLQLLMFEL